MSEIAKTVKPSPRGELEITEINKVYLEMGCLSVDILGRGYTWLDAGTHESLLEASHFVQTIENNQGYMIACLEEIAYQNKWITYGDLHNQSLLMNNPYGEYLKYIANTKL